MNTRSTIYNEHTYNIYDYTNYALWFTMGTLTINVIYNEHTYNKTYSDL